MKTKRQASSPSTIPAQRRERSTSHAISPPVPTASTSPPQTTTPATVPTSKSPQNRRPRPQVKPPINPAPPPAATAPTSPPEPVGPAAMQSRTRVRMLATEATRKTAVEPRKTRQKRTHTTRSKPPASPPNPLPCPIMVASSTRTPTKPSPPPSRRPDPFPISDSSWVGQSCSWA